jgi:hypothetical protein
MTEEASFEMPALDVEFGDITYRNLGTLLALSLFYLSGVSDSCARHARRLVTNLSISCAALHAASPGFPPLLSFLQRAERPVLSFDEVRELSALLAVAFDFATEQVFAAAFEILAIRFDLLFINLMTPWFSVVGFSVEDTGVVRLSVPCFRSFSTASFIDAFVRVLCAPPLQAAVVDLLERLLSSECAELLLIFSLYRFAQYREQCKALLQFMCERDPQWAAALSAVFRFKYWYYNMIQLNKLDQNFDIDKFLNNLRPDPGQTDGAAAAKEGSIDDFERTTDFALEVVGGLWDRRAAGAASGGGENIGVIVAHCLVHPNGPRVKATLRQILKTEVPTRAAIVAALDEGQISTLISELFLWVSSCGELSLALRAAPFLLHFKELVLPSGCRILVRTLQILVGTIAEKLGGRDMSAPQKKLMTAIFSGDIETEWRLIYSYIATVIELLSVANLRAPAPSVDVFWIIACFLSATSRDFGAVFPAVVDALSAFLKSGIEIHQDTPVPSTFAGFLPALVKLDTDLKYCPTSLQKLCWCLTTLAVHAAPRIIIPSATPSEVVPSVILLLVPYFATLCDEGLFDRFRASTRFDIEPIWQYFRGTSTRSFADVVAPIVGPLTSHPDSESLGLILRAYALFVKSWPDFGPSVYAVCTVLLHRGITPSACGALAKVAQHDRENRNARTACEFLEACRRFSVTAPATPSTLTQTKFPIPELPSDFTPATWKPTDSTDACEADAPPFYPTDPTLTLLPYAKAIKAASLAVRIAPFTAWSELIFSVEAMPPCVEPLDPPHVTEAQVKQFKGKLRALDQSVSKPGTDIPNRQSLPRLALEEASLGVTAEIFLPDQAEIDAAGADIPGADFPSVFPL